MPEDGWDAAFEVKKCFSLAIDLVSLAAVFCEETVEGPSVGSEDNPELET